MLPTIFKTKAARLTDEIVRIATNDAVDWARDYPNKPMTRSEAFRMFCAGPLSTTQETFGRYYDVLLRRIDSIHHG